MQPQSISSARLGETRTRVEAVSVPRHDQGIGDALRSAYRPRTADMPGDLAALLAKLG